MENNNRSQAVSGEGVNAPALGTENVVSPSLKDMVKQATGREYPSDEEALKGISETYKMVGKKFEPMVVEKPVVPDDVVKTVQTLQQKVQNFETQDWYNQNPQYKEYKGFIDMTGKNPSDVVNSKEFQQVYEKAGQSKSQLSSNSRIAMPKTDDYQADLSAMQQGRMDVVTFMAKHKGVAMPTD